jgi:hypothetical protein
MPKCTKEYFMFKNKKYGYEEDQKEFITFEHAIKNELNPESDIYAYDNDPQYSRSKAIAIDVLEIEVNALKTIIATLIPTLTKKQKDLIAEAFNLEQAKAKK